MLFWSMISSVEGITPPAMIPATASAASSNRSKMASITFLAGGFGRRRSVASVITPSVPSDPTKSWTRL